MSYNGAGGQRRISFWHCKWLNNFSLNDTFPNLFHSYPASKSCVVEIGSWSDSGWRWKFSFPSFVSGSLMPKEEEELRILLQEVSPTANA
ncbi:hypothetical protein KIW84_010886 [Lathyrus oleraceus]|uniref:Uncharacterized protein n=1 Tax=Pisum sativum TaxID=3888 RepID=A0A9D4YL84_PEA|nr:hypothetical protein KIW84_010886 [Pisum sativum]